MLPRRVPVRQGTGRCAVIYNEYARKPCKNATFEDISDESDKVVELHAIVTEISGAEEGYRRYMEVESRGYRFDKVIFDACGWRERRIVAVEIPTQPRCLNFITTLMTLYVIR